MAAKKAAAGPPSAKLAKFGIAVPARVAKFFDGPELAAHADVKAWGLAGFSADTKMKVQWGSPRLASIFEYASDFEADVTTKYLPIAAVGSESHMFAVDVTQADLPVYFFDYESGFAKWADHFDAFLGRLLKKGDRTPAEKLEKAYSQANKAHEKKNYKEILAILEPVVAQFPKMTEGGYDDTRETLGAAHNLIGIAYEQLKEIDKAVEHYEYGLLLGSDSGGLNVCDLYLNHYKDYAKLVAYAEKLSDGIWMIGDDNYAWFHVRNYLGMGYLLTGNPKKALRAYHQIKDAFAIGDPEKIKTAVENLKECIAERPETDKESAETILSWLDVPAPTLPAEKLAALKAWWPKLPDKVKEAIQEAAKIEKAPTDADFGRIAALTDLKVSNAELESLEWVTILDKLDDLDVEGNEIKDIAPVAKLSRLTRLDISQNKVKSLKPVAALKRLVRLAAGENPLDGIEGVESLHELTELRVNEAKLKSLEPCRGMEGLVELTIYENKIDDLSPLGECPRLKEISSFGNPLRKGWEALHQLRFLEEVNAGDKTKYDDVQALRAVNPIVDIDDEFCVGRPDDADDEEEKEKSDPDLPAVRAWWSALTPEWRKRFSSELDKEERKEPSDAALLELSRKTTLRWEKVELGSLEPLAMFKRCDYLLLENTKTSDLGPVGTLPRLRDLLIRDNPITSLAKLAGSTSIEELYMERCPITSLAGLENITSLREIYGEDNPIEDLSPLANLRELRILDLEGSNVKSVAPLAKLRRLKELKLGLASVTDLSPLADCEKLRSIEVWGNTGIKNAVALIELPDLERIISHGSLPKSEIDEIRRRRPEIAID